jgi:adenylosuccinate lyase
MAQRSDIDKYTTNEMKYIMSSEYKFTLWRTLWSAIASIEHKLGFTKITLENIKNLEQHIPVFSDDIQLACEFEKKK